MSKIPLPVSMRLPLYYEYVTQMEQQGCRWISSNMIANYLNLTSSTIRQDIKYLGKIDSSSFGYSTSHFREVLEDKLGIALGANIALIGIGSLGMALLRHREFQERNFTIKALFDNREELINTTIDDISVYPLGRMAEVIKRERINLAIITTPKESAQQVADLLVNANIKGIWNFAPVNLRVPPHICLENVNLMPSLFYLAFRIKHN